MTIIAFKFRVLFSDGIKIAAYATAGPQPAR